MVLLKAYTALPHDAHAKNDERIKFLVAKGADLTIKNDDGKSAWDTVQIIET